MYLGSSFSILIDTWNCLSFNSWCFVQSLSLVQLFVTPWSPPGSSVHGILQARRLEWIAISFQIRDQSNPCLLHRQVGSLLLSHQRSHLLITAILIEVAARFIIIYFIFSRGLTMLSIFSWNLHPFIFFGKVSISFAFLYWVVSCYRVIEVLCISWICILLNICFANIFTGSVTCLFIFFMVSFEEPTFSFLTFECGSYLSSHSHFFELSSFLFMAEFL